MDQDKRDQDQPDPRDPKDQLHRFVEDGKDRYRMERANLEDFEPDQ